MSIQYGSLASKAGWDSLFASTGLGPESEIARNIYGSLSGAGAASFLVENSHTDRDFSASYSAFYASLFAPYQKLCRRVHFFAKDLSPLLMSGADAVALSDGIQALQDDYLGFIVLRPLRHAPVGISVLSSRHLLGAQAEITVHAKFHVHLLGAELMVTGSPLTQQDTRIGACAQAAIWCVGRHFHARHGGAWFSMPDISAMALKPTDAIISQSLPAGSAFLTADNMVRALRGMDRHPVIYVKEPGGWATPPEDIIYRYLDSGIPVILALHDSENGVGHAVVAVGHELDPNVDVSDLGENPTLARGISHFYVMDDQRGPYRRLPKLEAARTDSFPWTLEKNCVHIIVPLPEKVFMPGEWPDLLARDVLKNLLSQRDVALAEIGAASLSDDQKDREFEAASLGKDVVGRTYLTHGWKYRARALRNALSEPLKLALLQHRLPRFVWVTEFTKATDSFAADPCAKRVLAHVVHDATGSQFWSSTLVADVPGLGALWNFEANPNGPKQSVEIISTGPTNATHPKRRGWLDFSCCEVSPKA